MSGTRHFFRAAQLARISGEVPIAGASRRTASWVAAIPQPFASLIVNGMLPCLTSSFGFDYRGEVHVYADCMDDVLPDGLLDACRAAGIDYRDSMNLPSGGLVGTVEINSITTLVLRKLAPADFGYVVRGSLLWTFKNGKPLATDFQRSRKLGRFWSVEHSRSRSRSPDASLS